MQVYKKIIFQLWSFLHYTFWLLYYFTGTQPREAPAMMQLTLLAHYMYGGYYPLGGASEIAFNIIPVIEKSGGKVLVRAPVSEIVVSDGKAIGM